MVETIIRTRSIRKLPTFSAIKLLWSFLLSEKKWCKTISYVKKSKKKNISWFCDEKTIVIPVTAWVSGICFIMIWDLHQEPTEFVRQNLKHCPSTRSLWRKLLIVLLQWTSEYVWEAPGISFQTVSSSQLIWDKEQGCERKSKFVHPLALRQTGRKHTCHCATNLTSIYKLLAADLWPRSWRYY